MRFDTVARILAGFFLVVIFALMAGCGSGLYQKGEPDEYPGKEECLAKDWEYEYEGYDGSWSCTKPYP